MDEERRKIHPKIQMIENGSSEVNAVRAEHSAAVAMTGRRRTKTVRSKQVVELSHRPAKAKKLTRTADDVSVNVFVHTTNGREIKTHDRSIQQTCTRGTLLTVTLPLSKIRALAAKTNVSHIELGAPVAAPTPVVSPDVPKPPDLKERRFEHAKHRFGESVLIGIIDVQGFDFSHPDFLDEKGKTRWIKIWDQGAEGGNLEKSPTKKDPQRASFDYGHEFVKKDLDAAIAQSKKVKLPAWQLEPQSQMVPGSHGTHVASIAAGNRGVCRNSKIAGVLIQLSQEDNDDRRRSFYDSTRIAHAVDYLVQLAKDENLALSINVSLGTNGHAHDSSSAISRWIDYALTTPGRAISIAAGNAGQEQSAFQGDLGYVMGRIHTSGRIASAGLNNDIEWMVIGERRDVLENRRDVSENELEIWYSPQDRLDVYLRPPGAPDWIGPVKPGEFIENRPLADGTRISIYNEVYHPANGANYVAIYLSPFMSADGVIGISSGQWLVRLHGQEVRDGRYHGWIERDDPRQMGRVGNLENWRFPSFFSQRSNVDDSSVSSLACGMRILSVANLDFVKEKVHITSSQGPTRDGRFKPDVAAPGTDIVAARGFSGPDNLWISMTGTSMASPYVCGVAGLMLDIQRDLTASQIEGIMQRTSRPLPGASYAWLNDAGFGRIDPAKCLGEAATINDRRERP